MSFTANAETAENEVIDHFIKVSECVPGHGVIRTEEGIAQAVPFLPSEARDTQSLLTYESVDDAMKDLIQDRGDHDGEWNRCRCRW